MSVNANSNSWMEWRKYVLETMKKQGDKMEIIDEKINNLLLKHEKFETETKIKLSLKASLLGLLGGMLAFGATLLAKIL